MDQIRGNAGPVSRHYRQCEPRYLARHELPDRANARRPEDWRGHLSLREGNRIKVCAAKQAQRTIVRCAIILLNANASAYLARRLLSAAGMADRPRQTVQAGAARARG